MLDELKTIRANWLVHQPFFGYVAMSIHLDDESLKEDSDPLAATDGKKIYINSLRLEKFLKPLKPQQKERIITVLFTHELMHVALMHSARMVNRNRKLWNIACDIVVNKLACRMTDVAPSELIQLLSVVYDEELSKLSVEEIYEKLSSNQFTALIAAGGSAGGSNDLLEPPAGYDQEEQKAFLRRLNNVNSNDCGNRSSDFFRLLKEVIEPKVDWKSLLAKLVSERARINYEWIPPNRRHIADDLYLPSFAGSSVSVCIMVDTSGSISEKLLSQFSVEISSILQAYDKVIAHVLFVDAEVKEHVEYSTDDLPLNITQMKGGGGTDLTVGFEWLDEHDIVVPMVIYLTDLYGPTPEEQPLCLVVWVTPKDHGDVPKYGQLIEIGDDNEY